MSLDSTVATARTGTKSLRATVPEGIVAFLELQVGDKLLWKMDIQDGERIVIVRKAKPETVRLPKSKHK
jgi:bifunctional DNA-binding transcriptional regulator/antitoxin component of YhaV-PrlF toxin-antitoxin module